MRILHWETCPTVTHLPLPCKYSLSNSLEPFLRRYVSTCHISLEIRNNVVASVPGLADLLALQSRSADIDDDLDSVASSSVASCVVKKRASVRLSTVKTASYSAESDEEGTLPDGNEDAVEEQENEKIVKAIKQATAKGQKAGKKAPSGTLQTKTVMTKKSRNPTAVNATSKESRLETENRNPEPVITSRRVEYI